MKQLFTSFSKGQIAWIKEKPFLEKISNIEHSLLKQNDATVVENLLLGWQGLKWQGELIVYQNCY